LTPDLRADRACPLLFVRHTGRHHRRQAMRAAALYPAVGRPSAGEAPCDQPWGTARRAVHPARSAAFARLLLRPVCRRRNRAARHLPESLIRNDPRPDRSWTRLFDPQCGTAHDHRLRRQPHRRGADRRAIAADPRCCALSGTRRVPRCRASPTTPAMPSRSAACSGWDQ
jgi:hypothetical protein